MLRARDDILYCIVNFGLSGRGWKAAGRCHIPSPQEGRSPASSHLKHSFRDGGRWLQDRRAYAFMGIFPRTHPARAASAILSPVSQVARDSAAPSKSGAVATPSTGEDSSRDAHGRGEYTTTNNPVDYISSTLAGSTIRARPTNWSNYSIAA